MSEKSPLLESGPVSYPCSLWNVIVFHGDSTTSQLQFGGRWRPLAPMIDAYGGVGCGDGGAHIDWQWFAGNGISGH